MFRFAARLSQILNKGDVPLTADEISGLDHYDLELEDALSTGSGDSLWELTTGDLHPTTDPDTFTVTSTGDAIAFDTSAGAGSFGGNTGSGDAYLASTSGDINLTSASGAGQLTTGGAVDVRSTGASLTLRGDDNVNIEAVTSGSVNLNAATKAIRLQVAGSSPGSTANSQIVFYLDEVGNNLKVLVTYAGGTVKTGTIALV